MKNSKVLIMSGLLVVGVLTTWQYSSFTHGFEDLDSQEELIDDQEEYNSDTESIDSQNIYSEQELDRLIATNPHQLEDFIRGFMDRNETISSLRIDSGIPLLQLIVRSEILNLDYKKFLIDLCLQAGADIDEQDRIGGWTALNQAIFIEDPELVSFLLDYNADPSIEDNFGHNAIGFMNHMDVVDEENVDEIYEILEQYFQDLRDEAQIGL